MAVSRIQVTEGSGKNIATYDFSESAVTKELQRIVISTSAGTESGTTSSPFITQPAHGKTLKVVTGSVSATTTIISAVTSKRLKVQSYALFTSSVNPVTVTFRSGAAGAAMWTVPMQATTGAVFGANLSTQCPAFLFATVSGDLLELSLSASETVTYSITYWDDDAS